MEKSKEMQRQAARAMKLAMRQGVDPYDTAKTQGIYYRRIVSTRRTPQEQKRYYRLTSADAKHVHNFDWDGNQQCECGAKFF